MIPRSGWFGLLLFGSCLLARGTGWAVPEHPFPSPSLQALFTEESARGVQRSETLSRALLLAAKTAPVEERGSWIRLASQADPTLVEPHLAGARDALRRMDLPGVFEAVVATWNTARRDPRQESIWMYRIFHSTHATLAATLVTLVILLALRSIPLACHAVGEKVGSQNAGTLLVLVPLLCVLALVPTLAVLVVLPGLVSFLRRRERLCLAAFCLLLASMHLWLLRLGPQPVLAHPGSRTARAACLNAGEQDPDFERDLLSLQRRSPEIELLLGMQARHRGDAVAARAHFATVVRTDTTSVAGYVNLSNVFFRAGQYERAAVGYRAAQALDPDHPVPHANLAATYLRLLEYDEADREQERATQHGFETGPWRTALWHNEKEPVLDLGLSGTALTNMARREAKAQPRRTARLRQTWLSGSWRSLPTELALGWLLVVTVLLASTLRWRKAVVPCSGCGTVVCASCIARLHVDERCDDCRPDKNKSRDPSAAVSRVQSTSSWNEWFTPFFPGAADLARGAVLRAAVGTMVGWVALGLALAAREEALLRGLPWVLAADTGQLRFAALLFLGAYLPGLIGFWNMRRARIGPAHPGPRFGPPESRA